MAQPALSIADAADPKIFHVFVQENYFRPITALSKTHSTPVYSRPLLGSVLLVGILECSFSLAQKNARSVTVTKT